MAEVFDINRIDDVIHGRVRLGIMAVLSGVDSADLTTLETRLQTTDGNLSVHLRKLEDAGFVEVTKRFEGRKPLTEASMTPEGRRAFLPSGRHAGTGRPALMTQWSGRRASARQGA